MTRGQCSQAGRCGALSAGTGRSTGEQSPCSSLPGSVFQADGAQDWECDAWLGVGWAGGTGTLSRNVSDPFPVSSLLG